MDYGKYSYEQKKRERRQRSQQNVSDTKEYKFGVNIEDHDIDTKVAQMKKHFNNGDNVRIVIRLRGRENSHPQRAVDILKKVTGKLEDVSKVVSPIKTEGSIITLVLGGK